MAKVPAVGEAVRVVDKDYTGEDFGEVLYQITEQKSRHCGLIQDDVVAKFYKNFVVFHDKSKVACYPAGYHQRVFPRYMVCDVDISKANTSFGLFVLGVNAVLWGFIGFIVLLAMASGGEEDGAPPAYAAVVPFLIFLIGIYILIRPFLFQNYTVRLKLLSNKSGGWSKSAANTFDIATYDEPDKDFLMKFAYGSLGESMSGFHSLAHLIEDNLFDKVTPREIHATGVFSSHGRADSRV